MITLVSAISMLSIVFFKAMTPLVESKDLPLPVDAWYPYAVEKLKWFWITYLHQVILGSSAVSAHVAVDSLIVGLLLKMSCQMNITKHRLKKLNKIDYLEVQEKNVLIQCVRNYERIYRYIIYIEKKMINF